MLNPNNELKTTVETEYANGAPSAVIVKTSGTLSNGEPFFVSSSHYPHPKNSAGFIKFSPSPEFIEAYNSHGALFQQAKEDASSLMSVNTAIPDDKQQSPANEAEQPTPAEPKNTTGHPAELSFEQETLILQIARDIEAELKYHYINAELIKLVWLVISIIRQAPYCANEREEPNSPHTLKKAIRSHVTGWTSSHARGR